MFPAVWRRVVQGSYDSQAATIHGFRRLCIRSERHPALIVSANAPAITGRVYFGVTSDDVRRLDYFETSRYVRVAVAATIDGQAIAAQSYLALHLDSLLVKDWSAAEFEQHGMPIFCETYVVDNAPPD